MLRRQKEEVKGLTLREMNRPQPYRHYVKGDGCMGRSRFHLFMLRLFWCAVFTLAFCVTLEEAFCNCDECPQLVVETFYTALGSSSFDTAANCLVEEDRKFLEAGNVFVKPFDRLIAVIYQNTTFKISNSKVLDGKAVIQLTLRTPNYGAPLGANIAGMFNSIQDREVFADKIWDSVVSSLNQGEFDYMESQQTLTLRCEDHKWRIVLYLEEQEKVRKIMLQALREINEMNYSGAVEHLNQILEIDKHNQLAILCLKRVEEIRRRQGKDLGSDPK